MSKFLFEGNFKRRPVQNLGGRSRHAEGTDIVLRRAQMERQKRENERARAQAVQVLQAAYRGMRERRKLDRWLRQEFQKELAGRYTTEVLERQLIRLNYFFKPKTDVQLLCDLGKAMLLLKDQLIIHILQDDRSMLRVRLVLEKALTIISEPHPATRSTILRLLETFTDWNQVENARKGMSSTTDPGRTEEVMAIIWTHLVLQKDFFNRYKTFLDSRLDVKDLESANQSMHHYDYTIFYQRFIDVVRRLSLTNRRFSIGKVTYLTKELVQLLLLKLAESVSLGILLHKGKGLEKQRVANGVLEFIVCPRVAHELTRKQGGKCLWNDEWLDVILRLTYNLTKNADDVQRSVRLRPLMYSFLIMLQYSRMWGTRQEEVLKVLNALMVSIDNRRQVFRMPDEDEMDFEDDEMNGEDMGIKAAVEEAEQGIDFFTDRKKIYADLQIVLENMSLHQWVNEFSGEKWNLMYQLMSCIIEMEPLKAAIHFQFLSALYNNPRFMRQLCIHVMRKEVKCKVELVVLCWLLSQLMKILHDGEFLQGIPLSREELLHFIKLLEDTYTDIVLGDKDVTDRLESYFKREIAHTLMDIHDRNTRIKIFSEEVFISSKFTRIFPMESHGITFKDFYQPSQSGSLSLLDQRLLRVLNDYPFALSFHDRVSIWHQLLHTDHVERHITDNPLGRQHIQIRRSYIYEDAYEKLSSENVQDLRSDVRISLVNVVGVQEAGVDGGGLLREFLTEATKAGVDPNRGLFRVDSENRIYPNPVAKKIFSDYKKHFFFMGRLVGKALYRQILLELPLAAFFMQLCTFGSISSAVDYLATLDPDLHKNLLKLRTFEGDWSELGLDFTVNSEELGETKIIELKPDGRNIAVDKDNVIEYIHLVSDYKINREIMEECRWFRSGLHDVVPVLRIFSWREMQTLISGSDKPIDVEDWKTNTNYAGGYTATHNTIQMFWQVVEHFDESHLRKLLKFVTSCSRPPLLGFKDLLPKFGISNAGLTDRLPTAATCMNLLKLPEFTDIETLRERLVYAISAQAGFELS